MFNSDPIPLETSTQVTPVSLNQLSDDQINFVQNFNWYKIVGYSFMYLPLFNSVGSTVNVAGSTTSSVPIIRYCWDENFDRAYINETDWDSNPGIKMRMPWRKFSYYRRVKPIISVLPQGSTSDFIDLRMRTNPWISTSDTAALYGRHHLKVEGPQNTNLFYLAKQYMYVVVRDPKINNPQI